MVSVERASSERGAGLAEYALLLVLIAIALFGALTALAGGIEAAYTTITTCLSGGAC
jgi:Flp pilus assembly pilin Flp